MCYLNNYHNTKFSGLFDTGFEMAGVEIVDIPFAAPNANVIGERWGHSIREECLDHLIILSARHLRHVLSEFITMRDGLH